MYGAGEGWSTWCAGMRTGTFSITATVGALLVLIFVSVRPGNSRDQTLTIDGQEIHIESLGETGPIVVFESGLGNDSSTWRLVAGAKGGVDDPESLFL